MLTKYVLKHFHFCCGLGGGAKGFNQNKEVVGHLQADWRCIGGVDVDAGALRDFHRIAGVPGTQMDLFTREQYTAFHGKEPPADWREATPADIRRAAGWQDPDVVFISSPCKGASGLLSEALSLTPKYQALNELTLRCVWLMCEAWQHNPPGLIVFENVPRLATRGRHLLDQILQVLNFFGYAVSETTHDCGELGGLAQSRKRFLLVARHVEKVPPFLYEPEKNPCNRSVLFLDACRCLAISSAPALCTASRRCNGKRGFGLPWSKLARIGAASISWPSRTATCATS